MKMPKPRQESAREPFSLPVERRSGMNYSSRERDVVTRFEPAPKLRP